MITAPPIREAVTSAAKIRATSQVAMRAIKVRR